MPFTEQPASGSPLSKDQTIKVQQNKLDAQIWTIERLREKVQTLKEELADEKHSHALTCLSLQMLIDASKGRISQTEFTEQEKHEIEVSLDTVAFDIQGVG